MNSEVNNNLTLNVLTPVTNDSTVPKKTVAHTSTSGVNQKNTNHSELTVNAVKSAADQSNPLLQSVNLSVEYSVDSATQEIVMKVVDTQNGKVIRQIPSAEMIDFVKRLQEWEKQQKGAVIQTRA